MLVEPDWHTVTQLLTAVMGRGLGLRKFVRTSSEIQLARGPPTGAFGVFEYLEFSRGGLYIGRHLQLFKSNSRFQYGCSDQSTPLHQKLLTSADLKLRKRKTEN